MPKTTNDYEKPMNLNDLSIKEVEAVVGRPARDVEVRGGSAVLVFDGHLTDTGGPGANIKVHVKRIKR